MKSFNYALVLLFTVNVAAVAQLVARHMDETEVGITAPALNELVSVTAQEEPTGKLRIGMGGSDSLPVIALLDRDDIPKITPMILPTWWEYPAGGPVLFKQGLPAYGAGQPTPSGWRIGTTGKVIEATSELGIEHWQNYNVINTYMVRQNWTEDGNYRASLFVLAGGAGLVSVTSQKFEFTAPVEAHSFIGDGSGLTGLPSPGTSVAEAEGIAEDAVLAYDRDSEELIPAAFPSVGTLVNFTTARYQHISTYGDAYRLVPPPAAPIAAFVEIILSIAQNNDETVEWFGTAGIVGFVPPIPFAEDSGWVLFSPPGTTDWRIRRIW